MKKLTGSEGVISSTINTFELSEYVLKQCYHFFPEQNEEDKKSIHAAMGITINRLFRCFSNILLPYYRKDGQPFFNHLHGDHYSMFLYLLCNAIWKLPQKNEALASKIFLLNKALVGIDAFYAVELPETFVFVHPIGTVLGKASYGNKLVFYQGVTVGATTNLIYPSFSGSTILYSNSSVIGKCTVGSNSVLGANASVVNKNIGDNQILLGTYPDNRVLENKTNLINTYFI